MSRSFPPGPLSATFTVRSHPRILCFALDAEETFLVPSGTPKTISYSDIF